MTNDDLIRLDQRVAALESINANLQQRVLALDVAFGVAQSRLVTLESFYKQVLGDTASRLLSLIDKATGLDAIPKV